MSARQCENYPTNSMWTRTAIARTSGLTSTAISPPRTISAELYMATG
jgi:hypothetical protein